MKRYFRLSLSITAMCAIALTQSVHAAAFQFYELGTPVNGTAGVGQAAIASDASTAYFNPAGMSQLDSTQLMLGTQMMLSYTNFSPSPSNTTGGTNGGSAGGLLPGASGFYVYNFSSKLKLGASLTTPYGGSLSYDNHWVGRYNIQQMQFYTVNLNPALSYQVNHWLALGAGVALEYANLYQTVAVPVSAAVDGQATVRVDNTSPGFNLGVLLTPTEMTKMGVAYRSQIVHSLHGNLSFLNLAAAPSATSKMVMPANIIASISQVINPKFTLLGEVGWAGWSSMVNTIVTVYGHSAVTRQNWHDTYRLGLGGQYQFTSAFKLQAGAAFDSSPTGTSLRTPSLPADKQIRLGAGVIYALNKAAKLGVSYEYINLGNASIRNTTAAGVLAGAYSRNYLNVVQASLNVDC